MSVNKCWGACSWLYLCSYVCSSARVIFFFDELRLSMNLEHATPPLIALIGPTASGKSSLGVWLAEQLGGEVVACDSTQLYRGFDIGTAKPTVGERRGNPHHLIYVLGSGEAATAGGYRQTALAVFSHLRRRGRLPLFTLGTRPFFRALLYG